MQQKKNKVCKFKENCPDWIIKKPCGFDHVQCKFKDACKDKQKCMFYHVAKPTFEKPKSQTLCKFNGVCNKPNCPFKHQPVPQKSSSITKLQPNAVINPQKFNKQCRFGADCKKVDCSFIHPNKVHRINSNAQQKNRIQFSNMNVNNNPLRSQNMNLPVNNNQFINRQARLVDNKFCLNYLLDNICQNGQNCRQLHQFCQKGSIKRIYFTTQTTERNSNIIFFQHSSINNQNQTNKQLMYVIQQNQTLSFRRLISSSNLYQSIGVINSSQSNKTYLRSINNQLFKAEGIINGIQSFKYQNNQFLIFAVTNKIYIYNLTKGQLIPYQFQRMNIKLTGCILLEQKGIILVSTLQQQLKCFWYNNQRGVFQLRSLNQGFEFKGLKTMKITINQILGQKIIYGISSEQSKIILLNKDLRSTIIQFNRQIIINDIQIGIANNKIPICLVSTTINSRRHELVSINLLNLQKQILMLYEQTSGINKIKIIQNHLLIQIKNKGMVIYKMNQFDKYIGLIPLVNDIKNIQSDQKGNLLIQQLSSVQSKGSISIFKVKRI